MSELLILIPSQFKLSVKGMEVIDSQKPNLILAEIVEKCICLIFLSFTFEWSRRQAESDVKQHCKWHSEWRQFQRFSPLTKSYCSELSVQTLYGQK